jgi:hypothetical protein
MPIAGNATAKTFLIFARFASHCSMTPELRVEASSLLYPDGKSHVDG